ncbi:MAG: arsenic metallochaperone ArsD family protein [Paenibacillaceae bacterium]
MMNQIEIFDPAMCCSTGVCGPGVNASSLDEAGIELLREDLASPCNAL